jgi:hypothetical protein
MLSLAAARANKTRLDFAPVKPKFIGRRLFKNVDLGLLANYIDWGPFFQTWDLAGLTPADDEVVGEAATKVFEEAQAMLKKIIDGRWLTANGVISLLPANSVNDDDIEIYTDDSRSQVAFTYYGLRQQTEKPVAGTSQPVPVGLHRAQGLGRAGLHRHVRRHRRPGIEKYESASRMRMTITPPSCSRPWPTAWPKPSPNTCTSACARTCGAMPPTSS